jgi:hypothetical protein
VEPGLTASNPEITVPFTADTSHHHRHMFGQITNLLQLLEVEDDIPHNEGFSVPALVAISSFESINMRESDASSGHVHPSKQPPAHESNEILCTSMANGEAGSNNPETRFIVEGPIPSATDGQQSLADTAEATFISLDSVIDLPSIRSRSSNPTLRNVAQFVDLDSENDETPVPSTNNSLTDVSTIHTCTTPHAHDLDLSDDESSDYLSLRTGYQQDGQNEETFSGKDDPSTQYMMDLRSMGKHGSVNREDPRME